MSLRPGKPTEQPDRLAALYEVSQALNSTLDLEQALVIVIDAALRLIGAERGFLMLVDARAHDLHFQVARTAQQETLDESAFEISRSVVQEVARSGQAVVTMDAQKDPRFTDKASVINFLLRSIMAVPLRSHGALIGVMYVDSKTRHVQFGQNDLELLGAFADQAATAIVNAQLYEAQKRDAETRQVLLEIAQAAQSVTSAQALADVLARQAPAWLACDRCVLFLWDREHEAYRPTAFSRAADQRFFEKTPLIQPSQLPLSRQVHLQTERTPVLLRAEDLLNGLPTAWLSALRPVQVLLIPIHTDTDLVGVLAIDNLEGRPFAPQTLALAEVIGPQLATAFQRLALFETAQRQLQELTALNRVAAAVTTATSVRALSEEVRQAVKPLLRADALAVLLIDAEAGLFRLTSQPDWPGEEAPHTVPLAEGLVGRVAASGQAVRVANVAADPHYLRLLPGTRSELCVPLKAGGRVIGVINAESNLLNAFTPADERLLETVAGQLATAIEKLRLLGTERQQRELAEALRDVGLDLTLDANLAAVMDRLLGHVARVVEYDASCALLVVGEATLTVSARGYERFGPGVLEGVRGLRLGVSETSNLRRMADTRQPLVVPDITADPHWIATDSSGHCRSWVGAPVIVQGVCAAFLSLEKIEPGFYTEAHARRLAAFAGQAALAIQNVRLLEDAERRAAELDAVRTASISLTSSLEIREVLNAILAGLATLLPEAQDAAIYLYHDQTLTFGAALRFDGRRPEGMPPPRPGGLTYTVAATGEPVLVGDTSQHPLFHGVAELWSGAIIGLPLKIGSRVVGVMNISFPRPRLIPMSEVHILRLLGEQAAAAIENASLFEAVRHQVEELTLLHAVATAGAETMSSDELIGRATLMIGQALRGRYYGVMLMNADGVLRPHPAYVGNREVAVRPGEGITGRVAATGQPQRVPDVRAVPAYVPANPSARSELSVPLKAGEDVIGVINVESDLPDAFTAADERLLVTVAGQLALALEKARLLEAERAARGQAEALREVANLLNSTLDSQTLLALSLEQLRRLVPLVSASVMLLEDDGRLRIAAHAGFRSAAQWLQPSEAAQWPVVDLALEARKPHILADTHASPLWVSAPDSEYIRAWIGVPLMVKDKVLGLINIDGDRPGQYTTRDAELAQAFGNQVAVALERLRLLEQTQRRERELAVVLDVARTVSSNLDLQVVIEYASRAVTRALGALACAISSYDPDTRSVISLQPYQALDPGILQFGQRRFEVEAYPLTAWVIDADAVALIRVGDPEADPAEVALLNQIGAGALLMLPVRVGDRPVGLVEVYFADALRDVTREDQRLARAIADQIAVAIENSRLFQAERDQRRLAEALRDTAISLSLSLDVDAVFDSLLDHISRVVPYDTAAVLRVDEAVQTARVVRHRGFEQFGPGTAAAVSEVAFVIQDTPTLRRMMETGRPWLVAEAAQEPGWVWRFPFERTQSWAGVPIVLRGRTVAFFNVNKNEPGFYRAEHLDRLAAFVSQASLALENAQLFEGERRRVTALTTLHAVSLELSAQLELPALLLNVLSGATRLLEARMGALYNYQAETHELKLMAGHGLPAGMVGQSLPVGKGLAGQVAAQRQALTWTNDAGLAEGLSPALAPAPRSALGVPVQWQGHLLAVLMLLDDRVRHFTEADVDIVRLYADRSANAIENVRLYGALAKEKRRLELLFNLSQNLAATLNPQEVAHRAMALMCAATGALRSAIFQSDLESGTLRPVRFYGYEASRLAGIEGLVLAPGQGIVGKAAQSRLPVVAAEVVRDPNWISMGPLDEDVRSAIAVPLLAGDELVGVLSLLSDRERLLSDEQVPLLRAAAVPVALAVQNARLFETEASQVYYLTLLNEITQAAVAIDGLPELYQAMVDRLGELAGAESCYLTLWDEARRRPIPSAAYGPERGTYAQTTSYQPGMLSLTESALQAGRPLVIDELGASPYISQELVSDLAPYAALALPLIAGDQRLGAVIITYPRPHHFGNDEVQRNVQAARQVALAIARARLFHETRRHVDELGVASDMLRTLNITPGVLRDFPTLAGDLKALAACQYVSLALLSPDRQTLTIVGLDQIRLDPQDEIRVPVTAELVALELLTGQSESVPDLTVSERLTDRMLVEGGYSSRLSLPLRGGEAVIGIVNLLWHEPAGYAQVNVPLIRQILDALALAIEKDRLLDETLRRAAELSAITEVSAALRAVATSGAAVHELLERSRQVMNGDAAAWLAPSADGRHLVTVASLGLPPEVAALPTRMDHSIAGWVFRMGRTYLTSNAPADPLADPAGSAAWLAYDGRPRPGLFAPVRAGDQVVGVLEVFAPEARAFTHDDLRLFNAIAELGGNALQRARVLETLEQRVEERTRELAQANERLQELDRLKDQFVSSVSHELRTPLTAIKLYLGLLDRRGAEVLPRYLPVLQRETERLRRLIEDLLDLSRLRGQSAALRLEPQRMDTLLEEVLVVHSTRAEARTVSLVHAINGQVPPVPVDTAQMMQVFTNLVGNAVAYAPVGGRVTVNTDQEAWEGRAGVVVRVHNDGPAIPPDDMPHLFTRFFRGKTAQESGEPGTGLGLAICQEIVDRHAGHIRVASSDAEGTRFTVWLPLTPPPAASLGQG